MERATRPTGPLLDEEGVAPREEDSPLARMTAEERLVADFRGTGLTVGPHPMAYHRERMNKLRVRPAAQLAGMKNGSRARVAGCVIARQRPGTAHGFVFLSLEDESGIANAIITPDMFERHRFLITEARFLLIEGQLQNLDNVISVKADQVESLPLEEIETSSHDFH